MTDLARQLPADAYSQLIRTLRLTLPPPLSDSPDDLAQRDHAAIARIAALAPANAVEADLAALSVAASEQAKECLRLAQQPEISAAWAMKCRAQAISMMRQAQNTLGLLLRMQATRRKLEADTAASDRAAWTEHCAMGLMAEALSSEPATMADPPTERVTEPEMVAQTGPYNERAELRLISARSRASGDERNGSMTWPSTVPPDRGHDTRAMAGEGARPNLALPRGVPPLTLPSPPASAGGEGESLRSS